jgi:hypothetical protein
MLAYNNDGALKDTLIAEMRGHREAERLVQGQYWNEGKGCAVGCLTKKESYRAWEHYETEWGIPRRLARIEDAFFENLPTAEALLWPERFLSAIRPGADLSSVWDRFAVWLLVDETWGVLQFAKRDDVRESIKRVAALYERKLGDESVSLDDWRAARSAAASASASDAAADAAAAADADADAAYDAAYTAAADAAADAASASASAATRLKWRRAQADKLIELLEGADVVVPLGEVGK